METLTEEEWVDFPFYLNIILILYYLHTHILKDLTLYKKLDENVKDPSKIKTECSFLSITLKSISPDLCDKITKNARYTNGLSTIKKGDDDCLNYKNWVYDQIWKFYKSKDTIKLDEVISDFLNIQNAVNKVFPKKICQFDFTSKDKKDLEEKLEKKNLRDYIKNYENIKKEVTANVKSDMYSKYLTYISKIFEIHKTKCEGPWNFYPKQCNEYFVLSTNPFKPKDLLDILQKHKAQAPVHKPEGPVVNGHAQGRGGPTGSVAGSEGKLKGSEAAEGPDAKLKGPKVVQGPDAESKGPKADVGTGAELKGPKVDGDTRQADSKAGAGPGKDASKGQGDSGKGISKEITRGNQEPGQRPLSAGVTVKGGKQESHKGPDQTRRSPSFWSSPFNIFGSVFSSPSQRAGSLTGKEQKPAGALAPEGKEKPLGNSEPSSKAAGAAKVEPKAADLPPKRVDSPPQPAKSAPAPAKEDAPPPQATLAQVKAAPTPSHVESVRAPKVLTPEVTVEIPKGKVMCPNGTIGDPSNCVSAPEETESAQSLEVSYHDIPSETYSLVEPGNNPPIMEGENYNIFTSNPERTMFTGAIILGVIYVFYLYYNATPLGKWVRNKIGRRRDSDYDDRSARSYLTLDNNSEYDDLNSSSMSFNVAYYPR
ncbi:variable surface protein Vir12, putative [Plasmodium vivax]|uniref:Variable surface protein Vir12, putative n=1 Tax=Plasmodium vivax (strain Salvador I) TaxID=126793 RepID=A5KCN6_PLAVS|nr:variable surface protein Vir12, putative [Plasmodium vivax]EDL42866.1 variable surface protein Vir12, putative [Plasmodium vivax]|eukprot:XP_001612640.1 variable surface protein Vir12 [Plasmodium vivax Sal-1]